MAILHALMKLNVLCTFDTIDTLWMRQGSYFRAITVQGRSSNLEEVGSC